MFFVLTARSDFLICILILSCFVGGFICDQVEVDMEALLWLSDLLLDLHWFSSGRTRSRLDVKDICIDVNIDIIDFFYVLLQIAFIL